MEQQTNQTTNQQQGCCSPDNPCCGCSKTWLIVIMIIVAFVAGGLVYAWQQKAVDSTLQGLQTQILNLQNQILKKTPPATATPNSDATASWKTYTNDQYGFTMKYPNDWSPIEITDSLQRPHLYRFQTPDGEIGFNVGKESYKASLEEYINSAKDTLLNADATNYILSEKKEITVDERKAIEIPNRGNNYEDVLIFVKNDNSIYQIVFTTKSTKDDALNFAPVNEGEAKVLNQMLSTFKFTK